MLNCHTVPSTLRFGDVLLLYLQAKRRVYTLQSGSKGAAGKRKRADTGSTGLAPAGWTSALLTVLWHPARLFAQLSGRQPATVSIHQFSLTAQASLLASCMA